MLKCHTSEGEMEVEDEDFPEAAEGIDVIFKVGTGELPVFTPVLRPETVPVPVTKQGQYLAFR